MSHDDYFNPKEEKEQEWLLVLTDLELKALYHWARDQKFGIYHVMYSDDPLTTGLKKIHDKYNEATK